ncbi:HAD family hydrolase [Yinghuangia seranimata]|uniref:HAD family hydrolase n=1 Tax=Yinghuangia seranimata TaxID=408067 RepID=UPI00248CE558|nr:HAD family phosphatase [Yinghuangia seranimata]MDI2125569.1 HAD family phosphatase [Yinghuangia seranimata]
MIASTRLVIFDCDGVLVDSERIAVRVQVEVLGGMGWPITADEVVERFIGRSAPSISAQIEEHLGEGSGAVWHERFHQVHREHVDAGLPVIDGITEALDGIQPHVATCVASGGDHAKMRHTLGVTGLWPRFEGRIFSSLEVARGKPAPDVFLYAAERMGVDPAECVVIEDSRYGVQAARAAGMRSFGYAGGLTPADWLAGDDTVVFDDMRKLPQLLGFAV